MKCSIFNAVALVATISMVFGEETQEKKALVCAQCNSQVNHDCGSRPGNYFDPCPPRNISSFLMEQEAVVCRKLLQYVDESYTDKNKAGERVIRQCGYEDDTDKIRRGDCYYNSGYITRQWTCPCKGDECNSASITTSSILALLATTALARMAANL